MSKKYFVGYDPEKPKRKLDFVVPIRINGKLNFVLIDKKKNIDHFMIVYTGVELTSNDVFKKMVDAGFKIENVDKTIEDITNFLTSAKNGKLGYYFKNLDDNESISLECLGKVNLI